jgi:hypothetical protein
MKKIENDGKLFADHDPAIIQYLKIICAANPEKSRPTISAPTTAPTDKSTGNRLEWALQELRTILANWERTENIEDLERDLGLVGADKRRHALTVRSESTIAMAVRDAALAGRPNPFDAVVIDEPDLDVSSVRRTWRKWETVFIADLEIAAENQPQFAEQIRAAIKLLKKQNKN